MKKLKTFLEFLLKETLSGIDLEQRFINNVKKVKEDSNYKPNEEDKALAHGYGLLECGFEFECYLQPLSKFYKLNKKKTLSEDESNYIQAVKSIINEKIHIYDSAHQNINTFLKRVFPTNFIFNDEQLKLKDVEINPKELYGKTFKKSTVTTFLLALQQQPQFIEKYGSLKIPQIVPFEFIKFFQLKPKFGWNDESTGFINLEPNSIDINSPEIEKKINGIEYYIIEKRIQEVFSDDKIYLHNKKVSSGGQTKLFKQYHLDQKFKIENPDYWYFEEDSSLSSFSDNSHFFGIEIISPHWKPNVAQERIVRFKEKVFDFFEGVTNQTTSMHCSFYTPETSLNPVKLLMLLDENLHLNNFKRLDNEYTKPQLSGYLKTLASLIQNTSEFRSSSPKEQEEFIIEESQKYLSTTGKYVTVKFKDYNFENGSGRVEFRIIGDDYFNSLFGQLKNSLNGFINVMVASTDKDWFHQEYIDKLMKHVEQITKKPVG